MGVGKGSPPRGEFIDMRRLDHGMTTKVADPIVLVVNGDKQDVGFGCVNSQRHRQQDGEKQERQTQRFILRLFEDNSRKSENHFSSLP